MESTQARISLGRGVWEGRLASNIHGDFRQTVRARLRLLGDWPNSTLGRESRQGRSCLTGFWVSSFFFFFPRLDVSSITEHDLVRYRRIV